MTVRTAELLMTLLLAAFSVYLMVKSAELEIGWIQGEGPGGGAWPFWLAGGMLACCLVTLARWWRGLTPESRNLEAFIGPATASILGPTVIALAVMLGLIHVVGVYFAILAFLLFYLRFMGRHGWTLSLSMALVAPVATFFFFEAALRIILPKGYSEPLFYPLYRLIY
jgi:hypothetical protein